MFNINCVLLVPLCLGLYLIMFNIIGVKKVRSKVKLYFYYLAKMCLMTAMSLEFFKVDPIDCK